MSELPVINPVSPQAVTTLAAVFATTAEGHLAAQVGDLAWLAIPVGNGLRMASAWRLRKPIADWTASDFTGADGFAQEEAAENTGNKRGHSSAGSTGIKRGQSC